MIYRIVLKPNGPITEIPNSISFFGSICHNYLEKYGEEKLKQLLEKDFYGFYVSSFFYHHTLPIPLDIKTKSISDLTLENAKRIKERKKVKFISLSIFNEYRENKEVFSRLYNDNINSGNYLIVNQDTLIKKEDINQFPQSSFLYEEKIARNKLSSEKEDKQLFYNSVTYCNPDLLFDAYIKTNNQDIIDLFKKDEYLLIGSQKSIGRNMYIIQNVVNNIEEYQGVKKILISKSIGDSEIDYDNSYYKLSTENLKFNNNGINKLYKNKVFVLNEGSVISTNKDYIGSFIVSEGQDHSIYTNLIGFLY